MSFNSKSQFAIHIRTHSTAGQNFQCNICGRTFIRESYLIRHHNRVHRDMTQSASIQSTINSVVSAAAAAATDSNFANDNSQMDRY